MLSTKMIATTDVRTNCPDSKNLTVILPVQSEFTVSVPVKVSSAKPPPAVRASVPAASPPPSMVALPTAAIGIGPVGRKAVPDRVNPQSPAALAVEQAPLAYAAGAAPRARVAKSIAVRIASVVLRIMWFLLVDR